MNGEKIPPVAQNPLAKAVESVRVNLVPMVVLWMLAAGFLVLYYWVPGGAALFGPLNEWQTQGGAGAAFLNRVLFLGVLPGFFLLSFKSIRPSRPHLTILAYALWGGAWGVFDDWLFTFLSACFGHGNDMGTLVKKTLAGQLIGTILVGLVPGTLFFRWVAADFSIRRVRAEWPQRFFREACLALLLANWIVWIPVNVCTYAFPLPLQIQLVGLAGCFWMLVGLQAGRRSHGSMSDLGLRHTQRGTNLTRLRSEKCYNTGYGEDRDRHLHVRAAS